MIGSMLLCAWLAIGPVERPAEIVAPASQTTHLRKYHEIEREIRELMQRESRATTRRQRAAAAYDMAYLFVLIQLDPRLPDSPTLAEFQSRLRSRLMKIKQDVQRDLDRQRRTGGEPATASAQNSQTAESQDTSQDDRDSKAGALGGGAGPPDWGPGLVELIERTIAPEFWDVNGGPGTIYYYYPLKVLVVRATSEIHHRVGGALTGLRDAGR